ncbi:hypothetical protein [Arthrobacter caoxuetaonis]|uniref:Uncharacterized protein n=1 Tax=Arthrobacter caoxuetaonis TaxID=2886935 RepID=A0A9X1MGM9_9MICC|nr:hypothetical protein [Arthrobacter caoxuetaonis]MCC3299778.1 hypothetical protein [Arthrobacter caoxuetaonis]USQ59321.1 hypothetical protein NF551_17205 [Arthrobacter caoxuetaonis]
MSEATIYTLRAAAREGGEKHFPDDIAQLEDITFAEMTFTVLDAGETSAILQAESAEEIDLDDDFVQAFEDALVSSHGIYLDIEAVPED